MKTMTGGCMCRRIRFTAKVKSDEAYLCHCRMCQLATGNVSIAFVNVPKADVTWHTEPDWYASSPIAKRPFCSHCGTSLGFAFPEGQNVDLSVAAFDEPRYFRCTSHSGVESRLDAWWKNLEGLPEQRTEDLPHIVQKWKDAGAEMPPPLP